MIAHPHARVASSRREPLPWPLHLRARQPQLAAAAEVCVLALVPVLIAALLDHRTVNDINIWIKPAKFLVSLALYYATLAWVAGFVPRDRQRGAAGRFVVWAALGAGLYEMGWLITAASVGVPSHYNVAEPAWRIAYQVAGVAAVFLILAILVQGLQVARHGGGAAPPALHLALVLGAVIAFGATLYVAGYLSSGRGHWVGGVASDAGGLPLLGWSTSGGDLRVPHFFALHAQQALPLLGVLLVMQGRPQARLTVWAGAAIYLALIAFTFVQATAGRPFLGGLS